MRITQHPILRFDRGKELHFTFNGRPMTGFEGETIAAALHAAGVKVLAKSENLHRPRGFFCAIGNCASCQMTVDGEPNVRTCITLLREGMEVESQEGKGRIK